MKLYITGKLSTREKISYVTIRKHWDLWSKGEIDFCVTNLYPLLNLFLLVGSLASYHRVENIQGSTP